MRTKKNDVGSKMYIRKTHNCIWILKPLDCFSGALRVMTESDQDPCIVIRRVVCFVTLSIGGHCQQFDTFYLCPIWCIVTKVEDLT